MAAAVIGLERLILKFKDLSRKGQSVRLVVGYSAPYATFVHERVDIPHRVGQAKYLETPLRAYMGELGAAVRNAYARGASLADALLAAGRRLLELSQPLVPVRTGYLKGSGFVRVDS